MIFGPSGVPTITLETIPKKRPWSTTPTVRSNSSAKASASGITFKFALVGHKALAILFTISW